MWLWDMASPGYLIDSISITGIPYYWTVLPFSSFPAQIMLKFYLQKPIISPLFYNYIQLKPFFFLTPTRGLDSGEKKHAHEKKKPT